MKDGITTVGLFWEVDVIEDWSGLFGRLVKLKFECLNFG